MKFNLHDLRPGDGDRLRLVDGGNGWNADPALWACYLTDQASGRRVVVIAWHGERPVGYGTLLWESAYEGFRSAEIPEINNVGVDAAVRGRGVATALIRHFEECARSAGKAVIGLGVGLYPDYGPAQRLYTGLGYRPDGHGVTWRNRRVAPGESVLIDDDLILWFSKALSESGET